MVTAKAIVLIVSIVMPREIPDVDHVQPMASFDDCWKAAKAFTERDLTEDMRAYGAIGLKATCAYRELESQRN